MEIVGAYPAAPWLQLAATPAILWVLLRLRLSGTRVPRTLIALAAIATVAAFVVGRTTASFSGSSVVVTRFADDSFGDVSRRFREQLNEAVQRDGAALPVWLTGAPRTHGDVVDDYAGKHRVQAVIWGTRQLLHVSFPRRYEVINEDQIRSIYEWSGLLPAQNLQTFTLSTAPEQNSARFLADLFNGLGLSGLAYRNSLESELYLTSALRQLSHWKSFAHRAVPAFVLGTRALAAAVHGEQLSWGDLHCAQRFLSEAAEYLRVNDNPDLRAAVQNNLAIVFMLRVHYSGGKDWRRRARKLLKNAVYVAHEKNMLGAEMESPGIARRNLRVLFRRGGKGSLVRKKVKRFSKGQPRRNGKTGAHHHARH